MPGFFAEKLSSIKPIARAWSTPFGFPPFDRIRPEHATRALRTVFDTDRCRDAHGGARGRSVFSGPATKDVGVSAARLRAARRRRGTPVRGAPKG